MLKKKPGPPPTPVEEKKKTDEPSGPAKIELSGSNETTEPPKVESALVDNDKSIVKTEAKD